MKSEKTGIKNTKTIFRFKGINVIHYYTIDLENGDEWKWYKKINSNKPIFPEQDLMKAKNIPTHVRKEVKRICKK